MPPIFASALGGVLGGGIGLFGAPHYEMASLVVGSVGAITGALAAGCAARSTKGVLASAFVTVVCAAGMALLASSTVLYLSFAYVQGSQVFTLFPVVETS